jgi:ferritin-like protein
MDRRKFLQRAAAGTSLFLPISSLFLAKDAKGASEPNQAPPLSAGDVDTSGLGAAGPVLVSKEDPLKFRDPSIKAIAEQLAHDELAHLHIIRDTFASFGLTPPARPTIDFKNSFRTLAEAAGIDRDFDPFDSERDFLVFAFFLEQIDGPDLDRRYRRAGER